MNTLTEKLASKSKIETSSLSAYMESYINSRSVSRSLLEDFFDELETFSRHLTRLHDDQVSIKLTETLLNWWSIKSFLKKISDDYSHSRRTHQKFDLQDLLSRFFIADKDLVIYVLTNLTSFKSQLPNNLYDEMKKINVWEFFITSKLKKSIQNIYNDFKFTSYSCYLEEYIEIDRSLNDRKLANQTAQMQFDRKKFLKVFLFLENANWFTEIILYFPKLKKYLLEIDADFTNLLETVYNLVKDYKNLKAVKQNVLYWWN